MIIVTGATGYLGRAVVEALARRVPAHRIGASARSPEKAEALAKLGVRVRHGDFEDAKSLAHAFEGATQVLVVSSDGRRQGRDTLAQHRTAFAAAREAGARRIVYTSHMAASASSEFPPMRDHAATEAMLREGGTPWTSLRNGFYASSGMAFMGNALDTGALDVPADGKVSWTAHADLAEGAAAILANEGKFEGPTPPLTASEALDFGDLARIASEVTKRDVKRRVVSDDDLRATMMAGGVPPVVIDISLGFYRASRNGEFAAVDPTLAQLIERAPASMRAVMTRALAK